MSLERFGWGRLNDRPIFGRSSALAEEIQITIEELNRLTGLAAAMRLKVEFVVITEQREGLPERAFIDARISFSG